MDSIIHSALEEICSHGSNGISLPNLWPKLHSSFSSAGLPATEDPAVKQAFWSSILAIPGLQFRAEGAEFNPAQQEIKSFDDCERLGLKIVADEQLMDCFLGLCDVKASKSSISAPQRLVLERLAMARSSGVTQNQLCKELGMAGNNFFYVVRNLECRGLVARQSTILRTRGASKYSFPVSTNLIHLYRYATPLGSQQRLEITKEYKGLEENFGASVDDERGECSQEDVLVKDFLPLLKAVCDKLEQADGKVLIVSDIKADLGYRKTAGHRAWRNICNRLQQAGVVEVFEAKMDATNKNSKRRKTPVTCLRLLKKFSPKLFEPKTLESGREDTDLEQQQSVRRGKKTEQLVELPIDQQIFDMIDVEGSKGLVVFEVCKRLGINNKKNHNRIANMTSKFGLHQLPENHNRGTAYRCWTQKNFNPESSYPLLKRLEDATSKNPNLVTSKTLHVDESAAETATNTGWSMTRCDLMDSGNVEYRNTEQERICEEDQRPDLILPCMTHEKMLSNDLSITSATSELSLVNVAESTVTTGEIVTHSPPKFPSSQPRQRYPSLTSARREQRILARLKVEKIILKTELQRWLENTENLEKEKQSKLDRKTLTRCLMNLHKEGHCRIATVSVPGVTNYGRNRTMDVVLHSSIESSIGDLSDQIHDKIRSFEMHIRGQGSSLARNEEPLPVLTSIQRILPSSNSLESQALHEIGIMLPKMSRARLLHCFLWDYASCSSGSNEVLSARERILDSQNPHSNCKLFALEQAVLAIPLELFFKLLGCPTKYKDIMDKSRTDVPLFELSIEERNHLMNTQATGRLSRLIDILRRLKLIRLVAEGNVKDGTKSHPTVLTHALELKPYIEEPQVIDPFSRTPRSVDLRPNFRHDFLLLTKEAVDKYWETLEYCYAAASPAAALHAFPGSSVHELIRARSWTRVKVSAPVHCSELVKRILKNDRYAKLTFSECKEIANDLEITLAQVLRVYYNEQRKSLNRNQGVFDWPKDTNPSPAKRRKICSESGTTNFKANPTNALLGEDHSGSVEEHELQEQCDTLISECAIPSLKRRQSRFAWDDEKDKQMILQYVRCRSAQGAKSLTSWSLIPDLPAPPSYCRRRLSLLNKNIKFRKSLMKLCNLLTRRYAQQLHEIREENFSCDKEADHVELWDNFDDDEVKEAFDEVIRHKLPAGTSKRSRSANQVSASCSGSAIDFEESNLRQTGFSKKSTRRSLPPKFVREWEEGLSSASQVYKSVAVANAVELFKLVFLNSSISPEVPSLLAESLRCYSEHDLFSAFDFLRENKIMVRSSSSNPYVLSQHFLQSLSMSLFPTNTGKRASKFDGWICERERDLMNGSVNLFTDLQCGDVLQLFALVSCGELSIVPHLPDEGIGEAEDMRSQKHIDDDDHGDSSKKRKYHSLQELEICSRREKGFPGISVSLSRSMIPRSSLAEFFSNKGIADLLSSKSDKFYSALSQQMHGNFSNDNILDETPDFGSSMQRSVFPTESQWEAVTNYAKQVLRQPDEEGGQIISDMLKTILRAVRKTGDHGLTITDVPELVCMSGKDKIESMVDVLEAFGFVLKVSGYDSVHVVDALYRSKYFLNSKPTRCNYSNSSDASVSAQKFSDNESSGQVQGHSKVSSESRREDEMNVDEVHKVTILNLSEESCRQTNLIEACSTLDLPSQSKNRIAEDGKENEHSGAEASDCRPILPWINGDGTINRIVYKGLTRRILGIVMQNPGILEDDVVHQMSALNPQNCKKLLELMILDKHVIVRKLHQRTSLGIPSLLGGIGEGPLKKPKLVFREHLFANPLSSKLL